MLMFLKITTAVLAVAWLPLLWSQGQRYARRGQPESAAVVSAMLVLALVSTFPLWLSELSNREILSMLGVVWITSAATCAHFHWAFWRGPRYRSSQNEPKGDPS